MKLSEIRWATALLHGGIKVPMGAASPEYFTWGKVPQGLGCHDGRNDCHDSWQSTALIAALGQSVSGGQQ